MDIIQLRKFHTELGHWAKKYSNKFAKNIHIEFVLATSLFIVADQIN